MSPLSLSTHLLKFEIGRLLLLSAVAHDAILQAVASLLAVEACLDQRRGMVFLGSRVGSAHTHDVLVKMRLLLECLPLGLVLLAAILGNSSYLLPDNVEVVEDGDDNENQRKVSEEVSLTMEVGVVEVPRAEHDTRQAGIYGTSQKDSFDFVVVDKVGGVSSARF